MKLRDARVADLREVASIHVAAWRAAYAGIIPDAYLDGLNVEAIRSRRESLVNEGRSGFLVAEDGDRIVGFAIFGPSPDADLDRFGQLFAIYVAPDEWHKGVGTALLAESCARLAQMGFTNASLWVLRDNVPARKFYEKHGWAADGHQQEGDFGSPVSEVRYRRAF